MTRGNPPSKQTPEDPELRELLSDIAFKDALAKLVSEAESAQINLQQLDIPGLGPLEALNLHRRYRQRECEKAQLRIEAFKLPREIEELERRWEWAVTPGARLQHKRRCMMLEAGRALGRSLETSLPKPPELDAKEKLNYAMAALESRKRRLHEITIHDDEWNALINSTPVPRRLVTQARGGIIERVCEPSAISYARLQRNALESEVSGGGHQQLEINDVARLGSPTVKSGRKSNRPNDFVTYAGQLWLGAKQGNGNSRVTDKQLIEIASVLDDRKHVPPARFLEGKCARDLRSFNSKNSRSNIGAIKTWSQLVALGDKDHLRGMRRLLSRCCQKHSG